MRLNLLEPPAPQEPLFQKPQIATTVSFWTPSPNTYVSSVNLCAPIQCECVRYATESRLKPFKRNLNGFCHIISLDDKCLLLSLYAIFYKSNAATAMDEQLKALLEGINALKSDQEELKNTLEEKIYKMEKKN
ncbi:hypothetical protein TNCV_3196821 [Trichonephila clavipes]|nr:hypothetical protein TNCV_3196821 [Trichonephila clavipes]